MPDKIITFNTVLADLKSAQADFDSLAMPKDRPSWPRIIHSGIHLRDCIALLEGHITAQAEAATPPPATLAVVTPETPSDAPKANPAS